MQSEDVERIAKLALRELGVGDPPVTVTAADRDRWHVVVGGSEPVTLTIRAGAGTTPNFVREQIFNQFPGR